MALSVEQVKTDLEAKANVEAVRVKDGNAIPDLWQEKIFQYIESDGDNSDKKEFKLIITHPNDAAKKKVMWHPRMPEIFQTNTGRALHLDATTVSNGLEAANTGWTVLEVNQQKLDEKFDRVTVKVDDGTNFITQSYQVWKDDAGNIDYKPIA